MDEKLIQIAESGDVEAMKRLGMIYREAARPVRVFKKVRKPAEQLLEHFLSQSYKWFLKAAEAGEDDSMVEVANCHESGEGVEKDQCAAFEWYQKAAALDNIKAINALGHIYSSGIEGKVEKDNEKALSFFIKVAEISQKIKTTPENKVRLLKKASDYEDVPSIISLGDMYRSGNIFEQDYEKAMEMYKKAVELGDKTAFCKIAEMYYCGDGVEQSDKVAFEWYMKAAKSGVGAIQVGRMYYKGRGVEQNFNEAIKYFQYALEHKSRVRFDTNESIAAEYLGRMYENGEGVEKNLEEAFKYYQIAAEHIINVEMMYKVADMYYLGIGVEKNYEKALENYERSAKYGYFKAIKKVIEMYELGEGVEKNIDKANEWRKRLPSPVKNTEE